MSYKSHGTPTDEQVAHSNIARNCKHGIVEIGVLNGDTSKNLLSNSSVSVYGIDPIIPDSMTKTLIGSEEKLRSIEKSNPRYKFFRDYSFNVVKNWKHKFDYIFIDGDHKYEAVKQDFNQWFPLLEKGGTISIHDSAAFRGGPHFWEGPSKLADELLQDDRLEYVDTIFCLTIFRKK